MTVKHDQEKLTWWRYSKYCIVDGMILPAPDARPTPYNPWNRYQQANRGFPKQAKTRDDQRGRAAYQDLYDLARTLLPVQSRWLNRADLGHVDLSDEETSAILAFTPTHGLLGVFHQEVGQVADPGARRIWVRWGSRWIADDSQILADSASSLWGIEGGALCRVRFEDLSKRFFGLGMPSPMPSPDSGEFFQHYGERVVDFINLACTFGLAVQELLEKPGDPSLLNLLIQRISKSIRIHRGIAQEEPIYPSLVAALADMFGRDQMAGLRLAQCSGCGQSIRTNFSRTRFCSDPCRWKVIKRAYRDRLAVEEKKSAGKRKSK